MKVSVILPTYNEVENIVRLIGCIIENIPDTWEYEILVVDDNSPDGTHQSVIDAYHTSTSIIPILRTSNRGFAKSIRAGIEKANGDRILVMDTDFTHDPTEIPKMLHISQVFDLVSGSRFCPNGKMDSRRHYIASLLYNWIIRLILRTQVQDNLGGFFIINREKLKLLPFGLIFFGYGEYYFRFLHFAQKNNLSIVEIPSYYHSRQKGSSKSNFIKLMFTYTQSLIRFWVESHQQEKV